MYLPDKICEYSNSRTSVKSDGSDLKTNDVIFVIVFHNCLIVSQNNSGRLFDVAAVILYVELF